MPDLTAAARVTVGRLWGDLGRPEQMDDLLRFVPGRSGLAVPDDELERRRARLVAKGL